MTIYSLQSKDLWQKMSNLFELNHIKLNYLNATWYSKNSSQLKELTVKEPDDSKSIVV